MKIVECVIRGRFSVPDDYCVNTDQYQEQLSQMMLDSSAMSIKEVNMMHSNNTLTAELLEEPGIAVVEVQ